MGREFLSTDEFHAFLQRCTSDTVKLQGGAATPPNSPTPSGNFPQSLGRWAVANRFRCVKPEALKPFARDE